LAWRAALRTALPDAGVVYDDMGAPSLEGSGLYVSAAHTGGAACVLISESRCAVDIEDVSRDFSAAMQRILSEREREILKGIPNPGCTGWCAKEAMYKYSGRRGLDLLHDIRITGCANGMVAGRVCGEDVTVHIRLHGGYMTALICDNYL
jgi:phosphopantetheinyl transferase